MHVRAVPVVNCCVIAKPDVGDAPRVEALIGRIAQVAHGEPAPVPHVTLVSYAEVIETQLLCLRPLVRDAVACAPPLTFQVTARIQDPAFASVYPQAMFFDIETTAAMRALHERLYRLGDAQCLTLSVYHGPDWRAHMMVLRHTPELDAATTRQVEALAAELSFTAAYMVISYRQDADAPWTEQGVYPLKG